jgi:sensor histidine kinase YesM
VLQSSASQEVSLAEELDFIRGYLEVEQMRLGERLRVNWELEPAALEARVPSLILQPLVENAIQHGISATSLPGELTIRAHREGAYLTLEVRDTGPGLAPGAAARSSGIGLSNTRIRLRSLYGERHDFALSADRGLIVTVRIPLTTS